MKYHHSWMRCPGDQCYDFQHARLFENVIGDAGNWVQLRLEGGPGSNRAAIGPAPYSSPGTSRPVGARKAPARARLAVVLANR